jgi:hypothetical protein
MIETGESEMIFQKAILEQGRGYVMDTLAEIRERRDAGGCGGWATGLVGETLYCDSCSASMLACLHVVRACFFWHCRAQGNAIALLTPLPRTLPVPRLPRTLPVLPFVLFQCWSWSAA